MIDNILIYNRQGRNLEGYDELYADPDVKNALQLGNDTVARSYIKDKLCSLGLMNVSSIILLDLYIIISDIFISKTFVSFSFRYSARIWKVVVHITRPTVISILRR